MNMPTTLQKLHCPYFTGNGHAASHARFDMDEQLVAHCPRGRSPKYWFPLLLEWIQGILYHK